MSERPSKVFRWAPPESAQVDPPIGKQDVGFLTDDPVYAEWMNSKWANDYEWKEHLARSVSSFKSVAAANAALEAGERFYLDDFSFEHPFLIISGFTNTVAVKVIALASDGVNAATLGATGTITIYNPDGNVVRSINTGITPNTDLPAYIYADGASVVVAFSTSTSASLIRQYSYSGTQNWTVPITGSIDGAIKLGAFFMLKRLSGGNASLLRVRYDGDMSASGTLTMGSGLATDGSNVFSPSTTSIRVYALNFGLLATIPYTAVGSAVPVILSGYACVYIIDADKCIRLSVNEDGALFTQTQSAEIKISGSTKGYSADANYICNAAGFIYDKRTMRPSTIFNPGAADITNLKPAFVAADSKNIFYAYQKFDGTAVVTSAKINTPPVQWMRCDPLWDSNPSGLRAVPVRYFEP